MKKSFTQKILIQIATVVLALFALLAPSESNAQCEITSSGCNTDDVVVCADSVNAITGQQGKYLTWTAPDFTLTCVGDTGETQNFFMSFDLPESNLAAQCWEFNGVQRTGQSSDGWMKLWQSSGSGDPYIITPLTYFHPNTDVTVYFTVPNGEEFTWHLILIDEAGVETEIDANTINSTGSSTLSTPDTTGAFYLKFLFTTALSNISNKNTIDDIVHDGVLLDVDCASGIDFTVSGPAPSGFFIIGDTTLTYTATYTPSDGGAAITAECSFNIIVEGVQIGSLATTPESCAGNDGTVTIVATSPTSGTPDLQYSIDNGAWTSFNSGETITGLTAGVHTLDVKDLSLQGDCGQVELSNFTVADGDAPTAETIQVEGCETVTVNDSVYTATGVYTQMLKNAAGCDSTLTVDVTILEPTSETIYVDGCETVTVNDSVYTATGVYTQVLKNAAGCDSTLTVDVTILEPTSETIYVDGCETVTVNDSVYTATGVYTQMLKNAAGCDSTLTVDVT
ncbi:hypothetical protein, partial [Maribellus sediminis]|uniref:hypothetical protein n=1 Tax=Maribellus sediminis TaxID=2696285 RepID=UPI00143189BE